MEHGPAGEVPHFLFGCDCVTKHSTPPQALDFNKVIFNTGAACRGTSLSSAVDE